MHSSGIQRVETRLCSGHTDTRGLPADKALSFEVTVVNDVDHLIELNIVTTRSTAL
jgi:hypothetical protein